MGCDIHTSVEFLDRNNKWQNGNIYFHYNDGNEKVGLCEDRNYTLFAVLANVRNYGKFEYMDDPRGIPKDATTATIEDYEWWGCDAHSASYFTLRELIEFQESHHILKRKGFISSEQAERLDNFGVLPDWWSLDTNSPDYVKREWTEKYSVLDNLIDCLKKRADELNLIYDFLWDRQTEETMKLAEHIRIVFWFDN